MPGVEYKSTVFVSLDAAVRARARAEQLGIKLSQVARAIIVLAIEGGALPPSPPDLLSELEGEKSPFPFTLDSEIIKELGGKDRARDYVRWAIMEGLTKGPLAGPED